jgi:hypothetical protein
MKFAKSLMFCMACNLVAPALTLAAGSEATTNARANAPDAAMRVAADTPPIVAGALPADPASGDARAPADSHPVWHDGPPAAMPRDGMPGPHGFGGRPEGPPEVRAAIRTIDEIEGLYVDTGKAGELPAFYRNVLSKTHDPMLRDVVLHRLADTQLKPAHADEAIATLRGALDETLTRLDTLAPPRR